MNKIYIITVELEDSAAALALREKLIEMELTPTLSFKEQNGTKTPTSANPNTSKVAKVMLDLIKADPDTTRIWTPTDFLDAILEANLAKNSISPTLYRLTEQGELENVGKGMYIRASK